MNANMILATKDMGAAVIATTPEASLLEAARQLTTHRIGVLAVRGTDGALRGILSERDIVRSVAEHGAEVLTKPVSEVMTRALVTAAPAESVDALMERMTTRRIRHLPVMDGARLLGLISIGDVVKAKIAKAETETEALRSYVAGGM